MTTARRAGAASAAALIGLALALGFAHAAAPTWVRRAGLDLWNLPSLRHGLEEGRAEESALRERRDRLDWMIETTDHAAARLIDGSLTLAAAVDELSPVLATRHGFEAEVRYRFNAETFRRGVAAYLIDKAGRALAADPTRWAAVSARLQAEFAAIE